MSDDKFRTPDDVASRVSELRSGKSTAEDAEELMAEEVEEDDPESFSKLSADRMQKVMLELRFKTGNAKALAYSYLIEMDFNPSDGIVMDFTSYEVQIIGRNLRKLFTALAAHRVASIQEMDDLYVEATRPKDATIVTQIVVAERADR